MERSNEDPAPRRAPFKDIQNTHPSGHIDRPASKLPEKLPLSNKLRAIQIGQRTLAAFKERKAEAKARRTAAKAAAGDLRDTVCQNKPRSMCTAPLSFNAAANACSAAQQTITRVTVQRHAQTPSKIPPATHAPARSGPRLDDPTPTKIPNAPKVEGVKAPTPTMARSLQAQSVPVSPGRNAAPSAGPYSALPTPRVSPQAASIQGGPMGGQRNPLFDDTALRTTPQAAGLVAIAQTVHPTAFQLPMTHEAVCAVSMSNSSCSGTVLGGAGIANLDNHTSTGSAITGPGPLSIEVDYAGGSGPQSVHSMASGLSRSGSFAPSTLSVLYENQAMKVEREELKSELKLISARLAVLEARSKGWGRIGQAPKGRSQSAPRGVPRSRVAPASRPAAITEQHTEPERAGRPQSSVAPQESAPGAAKVLRETLSRPSSPRKSRATSFGSRAGSPARQRRAIVFGSRAPSPTHAHLQTARNVVSQKPTSSRADSPVARDAAQRQNRSQNAAGSGQAGMPMQRQNRSQGAAGSGQAGAPMQPDSAMQEPPVSSMPYRSAFMGGHMVGTRRVVPSAMPHAAAGVPATETSAKPDLATNGPPAPPAGTLPAACPSSVERWAGPGGRLGRTRLMGQTPRKGGRQKTEDKENSTTNMVEPKEQVSKLALTAAKLGLQHAFRPRLT